FVAFVIDGLQWVKLACVSTEDANQKFLRSLPSAWSQAHCIILKHAEWWHSYREHKQYNEVRPLMLDEFDLEEMDLKWKVAMISMRMKKFYKKTGRKLQFDAKELVDPRGIKIVGGEMLGTLGIRIKKMGGKLGKQEDSKTLVTLDGEGVDWTSHSEDEQENYALMAYSSSGSDTEDYP
ncbi:hypothetical protein Tco_0490656, partial [Tanacetum coccineum]